MDRDLLVDLYHAYNPAVSDAERYVEVALEMFPLGNCGLATVLLQHYLGGEIVNGSYDGRAHTFLLLYGLVVDITADQFGGPEVYVGPLQAPWAR
jgi:hypothetical protein